MTDAVREIAPDNRCRACGFKVTAVSYVQGGDAVLYGPCRCPGWTAEAMPELAAAVRELEGEGLTVQDKPD